MGCAKGERVNKFKVKKYWVFGEDEPPVYYRPKTSDEAMIQHLLIEKKDYLFPQMPDCKLVYDMGANIGVMSIALSRTYPDATIHAFEPEEENFEVLKKNVELYPKIVPHKYALGSSTGIKKLFPSDNPMNKGGFSTIIEHGEPVQIGVQSIKSVVERYGIPDVLKVDVEGAECEILRNFPNIDKVKWIAGELHGEDAEFLLLHILSVHFRFQFNRTFFDKVWQFQALNKTWSDFGRAAPSDIKKNGLEETYHL